MYVIKEEPLQKGEISYIYKILSTQNIKTCVFLSIFFIIEYSRRLFQLSFF